MLNKLFWTDALIRAVRTFAQTAVALLGVDAVGFADVNWIAIVSTSGVAAVISILTSVARIQSPLESAVSVSKATEADSSTTTPEEPETAVEGYTGSIQPPKKLG